MTTNYRELRNAIGQWCFNTTGRTMRIAGSGEVEQPRVPYAVIWINEDASQGYPRTELSDDGLSYSVIHTAQYRIQVDVYGGTQDKSAMQDASLLRNSLYNPILFEDSQSGQYKNLWEICGLLNTESINDLSALETGIIKQRAQFVFNILAEMEDTFTSDYFDKVEVNIKRSQPDMDIETITVDANEQPPAC